MSIKLRNTGEVIITLTIPGTQTASGVGSKSAAIPAPFSGQIKSVWAVLGNAGITGSQTTDLTKNGSSLVASGTLLAFATTVATPTYPGTLSANPPQIAQFDLLRLSNTAVHSGTAGLDLTVIVVIQKLRGTGPVAAMATQDI